VKSNQDDNGLKPWDFVPDPVPGVPYTATEDVYTEFGSFTIDALSIDDVPAPPSRWVDHMVAFSDTGLFVATGIALGNVNVTVEALSQRPAAAADQWEHVVEASLTTTDRAELYVNGFDDANRINRNLATAGPGDYRIRISARGRAIAFDDVPDTVTEHYLVQVWPEPSSPPVVLRSRD
jgi:hypothetical protein